MIRARSMKGRAGVRTVVIRSMHRRPFADRRETRRSLPRRSRPCRLRRARNHPAACPNRGRGERGPQALRAPRFPRHRSAVARARSTGHHKAALLHPRDPRRTADKFARLSSHSEAMVDPVKEVFDLSRAFGGVEQFERGFALQDLRRTAKLARRLVLRSEGFLGGSKNPNHTDQAVRLLRRKSANLAPVAQGLSR